MTYLYNSVATATLLLCLCMASNTASAQARTWSVDLTEQLNSINWVEQANDGTLIAAGDKGLMGMNHLTGEQTWILPELSNVDRSTYFSVEGLPIFYVEYAPLVGRKRGIIANSASGEVLYDTQEDDVRVKTYTMLPEQGALLFEAMRGDTRFLIKFDLNTLSAQWTTSVGDQKGLATKIKDVAGIGSFVTQGPYITNNDKLLLGIKDEIYALDFNSGEQLWQQGTRKKIKALVYSPLNDNAYLGIRGDKKLTVLDPNDGADITPGKLKLKGSMIDVVADRNDQLILVESEGFNIIDPKTNDFKWKKNYKVEALDEVMPYRDGYLAIGRTEKDSEVHYVDQSGDDIWDQKVKGYAYFVSPMESGIMYISTERSNILNLNDGKDIWKKDVKFKAIPAIAAVDADNVFLFENKTAYTFNLKSGKMNVLGEDLALEKVKKDTPLEAEAFDGGYFVYEGQHVSFIDKVGKLDYTRYYESMKSVDLTGLAQFGANLAGIDVDIRGNMNNFKTLKNLSNGTLVDGGKQTGARTDVRTNSVSVGASGNYTELFSTTSTRYSNAQATRDYYFVTTKSGDDSRRSIVMLDKQSGETIHEIDLVDKDPAYVIDALDGLVFVAEKGKTLSAYRVK